MKINNTYYKSFIAILLMLSLNLYGNDDNIDPCSITPDESMGSIEAEAIIANCTDSTTISYQKELNFLYVSILKVLNKDLKKEFTKTHRLWEEWLDVNMYEYVYFMGGYPYFIEAAESKQESIIDKIVEYKIILKNKKIVYDNTKLFKVMDYEFENIFNDKYEAYDKKLNIIYRQLRSKLDKKAQKKLLITQRAWIKQKEKICNNKNKMNKKCLKNQTIYKINNLLNFDKNVSSSNLFKKEIFYTDKFLKYNNRNKLTYLKKEYLAQSKIINKTYHKLYNLLKTTTQKEWRLKELHKVWGKYVKSKCNIFKYKSKDLNKKIKINSCLINEYIIRNNYYKSKFY